MTRKGDGLTPFGVGPLRSRRQQIPPNINKLIRDVLVLLLAELRAHQVSVRTELNDTLPDVRGDRVQLQQVILNLLEAMNSMTNRPRVLRLRSEIHEPSGVLVSVEDSGAGVDPKDIDHIFRREVEK
jgi:C4-dicarboxylate-specific signal transduction histidine kinase